MNYYKRLMIEAMQPKEEPPMEVLGWVPVAARQPDDGEQCLVAYKDSLGIAWWHSEPQEFIHDDIDNAWTPTHWMPLPEPPLLDVSVIKADWDGLNVGPREPPEVT